MLTAAVLVSLAGLLVGSFLTVLAHRLPAGENFVTGRSKCPQCGATITARDNIPVVSWLLLKGRCRNCGNPISVKYPLAEIATALLYLGTLLILGTEDIPLLALGLVFVTILVAVTLTDLEYRLIPNVIVAIGALIALAVVIATGTGDLTERLIAAVAGGGFLFIVAFLYPRGMGMGDVKLVAMMGLYLGSALAPALLVAFAAGALVGIAMIARHGGEARKRAVPFAPFLALGGVVGLWAGDSLVRWYTDTFFGA